MRHSPPKGKAPNFGNPTEIPLGYLAPTLVFLCALGHFLLLRQAVVHPPADLYPWDAAWYRDLIENGYQFDGNLFRNQNVAFMPLYALTVRVFKAVFTINETYLAMMAVSSLLSYGTSLLFFQTISLLHNRRIALSALMLFLSFPYSLYLFNGYAEPAFTLCAMLFFHALLIRRHLWCAALLASVSVLTKQIGILLIGVYLSYVFTGFVRSYPKEGFLNNSYLSIFTKTFPTLWGGLALLTLYFYVRFRDPLLFNNILISWTLTTTPMTLSISSLIHSVYNLFSSLIIALQYPKNTVSFAYILALVSFFSIAWSAFRTMDPFFVLYAGMLLAFNVVFRPNPMNPDLGRYMVLNFPFFVSLPLVVDTLAGSRQYLYWLLMGCVVLGFLALQENFITLFYHYKWVS